MKRWNFFIMAAMAASLPTAAQAAGNVLVNPGFETDAVLNAVPVAGATGWSSGGPVGNTASDPLDPVRSGIGSLQLVAGGGFSVPVMYQTFPAGPGDVWDLQGYMLTENSLPADATFALLKIVFSNGVSDLIPAAANIGVLNTSANPGVESLPFLDSTSAVNTWIFSHAQGVAPVGTTQVGLYAILVDQSAGTTYFDDLQGSLIPEPSSIALLLVGMACWAGLARHRERRAG